MPHLEKLRKGWQSENLARLILYNFSFVSEPSKVADDIGVDFFCTLFKRERRNGDSDLIPKSSVAIQVKSDKRTLNLSKHLFYLNSLEIPYLIGVADKTNLCFSIYSGEYLPHFFSLFGLKDDATNIVHDVKVKMCDRPSFDPIDGWYSRSPNGAFTLMFPEIVQFDARKIDQGLDEKVDLISEVTDVIYSNIALRKSGRSLLEVFGTGSFIAYAGRGSLQYFESNFSYGLAEVFVNLKRMYDIPNFRQDAQDLFRTYAKIYDEFMQHNKLVKTHPLVQFYEQARMLIEPCQ